MHSPISNWMETKHGSWVRNYYKITNESKTQGKENPTGNTRPVDFKTKRVDKKKNFNILNKFI